MAGPGGPQAGPAGTLSVLLSYGFRPFFLLAGLFAALAVPLWALALLRGVAIGPAGSALGWHAHEMVFGYVPAVLAGFLLTAVPNWTGRKPLGGAPLAALVLLWLLGRLAMLCPAGTALLRGLDCLFLVAFAGVVWHEILRGGNRRNVPVCILVSLLALGNVLQHFGPDWGVAAGSGQRLGLGVVTLRLSLIGGRIIPAFTTNWMKSQGLAPPPTPFNRFDQAVLALTLLAALAWLVAPLAAPSGAALVIAGALHALRLARWRGVRTFAEPLVTVLHVAYAWLPVALVLMGLAILAPATIGPTHALHALTAGGIALLTLAVMTRASLGHTGRALHAGPATVAVYGLVFLGAALRLVLPFTALPYAPAMAVAGATWSAGFLVFVLAYGPLLLRPRR
ncbi:MAG: NnrS family protein [Steroidobacteraceae bacterium]